MRASGISWKRKKILIDPRFQLGFTGKVAGALLCYALLFFNVSTLAPILPYIFSGVPESAMVEVSRRTENFAALILLPLLCTLACLFLHGIFFSFRLAGPNYRFKAVLRDLAHLRITRRVRVRKKDYMQDTADSFDAAFGNLTSHLDVVKEHGDAIVGLSHSVDHPELRAEIDALKESLDRIEILGQKPDAAANPADPTPSESPAEPIAVG